MKLVERIIYVADYSSEAIEIKSVNNHQTFSWKEIC